MGPSARFEDPMIKTKKIQSVKVNKNVEDINKDVNIDNSINASLRASEIAETVREAGFPEVTVDTKEGYGKRITIPEPRTKEEREKFMSFKKQYPEVVFEMIDPVHYRYRNSLFP
jgi:hypothetical protein